MSSSHPPVYIIVPLSLHNWYDGTVLMIADASLSGIAFTSTNSILRSSLNSSSNSRSKGTCFLQIMHDRVVYCLSIIFGAGGRIRRSIGCWGKGTYRLHGDSMKIPGDIAHPGGCVLFIAAFQKVKRKNSYRFVSEIALMIDETLPPKIEELQNGLNSSILYDCFIGFFHKKPSSFSLVLSPVPSI